MSDRYIPQEIEPRWQKKWADDGLYNAPDHDERRPKYYFLTMLPYTSGDIHIGHWYAMTPPDAAARYRRMRGFNVTFPIGFDAFGLPAEEAAIKHNIHPWKWTWDNIVVMRRQLRLMGCMWDWPREMVSCDPAYYRWTQWFFLQFYNNGLAYRAKAAVDWCPHCNTTLAREQVWGDDRHCERCKTPVIKKDLEQWFFRITRYAEELLDFSQIDWPDRVRAMQTNWIGRSVGVEFDLPIEDMDAKISVFTTRHDTVYGMTFAVISPEHPLVDRLTTPDRRAKVAAYVDAARRQTEIERMGAEREKTGVFTGSHAINPMNGARVPIFVGDYVLMTYGTGAIQGVPAHDTRDFIFARKYGLDIPVVIAPPGWTYGEALEEPYEGDGMMVNSGPFNGMPSEEGKDRVADYMEAQGIGRRKVNYRLRDWLISRQRYWGAPIPIVYCEHCGATPVPENQLPVLLPEDAEFRPTGESPLKYHPTFRHTTCPICGGPAERETDTMDTFMCSSWYHMRYTSPGYDKGPVDPKRALYWLPVDQYTGGIEHATMHLMYTRFFTKACADIGILNHREPMTRLFNQGMILGEDSTKMSKSRPDSVVNPETWIARLGVDSVRAFLMFMGPWEQGGPWSSAGINGIYKWLNRVWTVVTQAPARRGAPAAGDARALRRKTHQTIQRVTDDVEKFRFNTAIAALMELTNTLMAARETDVYGAAAWKEAVQSLTLMLAPMCPHISEEMWSRLGRPYSVHQQDWPAFDPALTAEETITLVVQVGGKVRDKIEVPAGITEAEALRLALASDKVARWTEGKSTTAIYVPGRLVNIVAK